MQHAFVQNQEQIESDWDLKFGDRNDNEIVFIGHEI